MSVIIFWIQVRKKGVNTLFNLTLSCEVKEEFPENQGIMFKYLHVWMIHTYQKLKVFQ